MAAKKVRRRRQGLPRSSAEATAGATLAAATLAPARRSTALGHRDVQGLLADAAAAKTQDGLASHPLAHMLRALDTPWQTRYSRACMIPQRTSGLSLAPAVAVQSCWPWPGRWPWRWPWPERHFTRAPSHAAEGREGERRAQGTRGAGTSGDNNQETDRAAAPAAGTSRGPAEAEIASGAGFPGIPQATSGLDLLA